MFQKVCMSTGIMYVTSIEIAASIDNVLQETEDSIEWPASPQPCAEVDVAA